MKRAGEFSALALGSTDVEAAVIFEWARRELAAHGWRGGKMSEIIRTEPVDCVPGTPEFANAVLTGYWGGTARELLELTQELEIRAGRPRNHGYHEARKLDLDILVVGDARVDEPDLQIPHPRAGERDFVLIPLRTIAPQLEQKIKIKIKIKK